MNILTEGYKLENCSKGWVIRNPQGHFLAWGHEDGDEEKYEWLDRRINSADWKTQYFRTSEQALKLLLELLKTWNDKTMEFEEKPKNTITL